MSDSTMASQMSQYRSLVSQMASALKDFQSSGSKFRVLKTIHPTNLLPTDARQPTGPSDSPKTLFILDSSFNPPSIAHQYLATSALSTSSVSQHPGAHRLLLLFATMNAEKAPSPASFEQRLTLMTIFAIDLLRNLQSLPRDSAKHPVPPIDIGVTSLPYYTDKSSAIAQSAWYPDAPTHIHLIGYDTLTRFFAPKFYKAFHPPLSALAPYFEAGHRLRAYLRPDADYGAEEDQRAFVQRLAEGGLETAGAERAWAEQVEVCPPNERVGVSSTRIRKAAKAGQWEEVGQLCTEGVAEWVREAGLYEGDDRGAKMA